MNDFETFLFQCINFFHDEMDENFFISKLVSLATWQLYIKVCFFMHFSPPGGLYFLEFSLCCWLCEASIKIMSFWASRQWFSTETFFMILISLRWNLPTGELQLMLLGFLPKIKANWCPNTVITKSYFAFQMQQMREGGRSCKVVVILLGPPNFELGFFLLPP